MWTDVENESFSGLNEEQWLEEIMDQYGDRLTKLSYSYLHDWGRAQEVVQDVFLICYKQYDTLILNHSKDGFIGLRLIAAKMY